MALSFEIPMPAIDTSTLTGEARRYAEEITLRNGKLRASKPKSASPRGRYIWRMVAFSISPRPAHQCMPVTCDFEIMDALDADHGKRNWKWTDKTAESKRLDDLADEIINTVPKSEWHGVQRWGRALGHI